MGGLLELLLLPVLEVVLLELQVQVELRGLGMAGEHLVLLAELLGTSTARCLHKRAKLMASSRLSVLHISTSSCKDSCRLVA